MSEKFIIMQASQGCGKCPNPRYFLAVGLVHITGVCRLWSAAYPDMSQIKPLVAFFVHMWRVAAQQPPTGTNNICTWADACARESALGYEEGRGETHTGGLQINFELFQDSQ